MQSVSLRKFTWAGLLALALPLAGAERYFGEPVRLQGRAIYFTSWKYVRQGSFTWRVQVDPNASDTERQAVGAWLKGDGHRPAVFETFNMPRGIRLVAQPAEKVPFKEGQLAAQLFDEGKYKAWYVQDPCADPEPFSSKDKILPGRTFAESDRIISNSLAHRVTWKGEETIGHQGRPIMLRVQMKQARLFGFECVQ